ncbi:MAG: hypothetical protein AAGD14_06820 [Planctomycetota bacterium]
MRLLLLIFLVLVVPLAVYWTVNGGTPQEAAGRLWGQIRELPGETPEPEPEPLPDPKPEPEMEVIEVPPRPIDEPKPAKPAKADPDELFRAGKFEEAAAASTDERQRSLAQLGAAFAKAFPRPREPYVEIELKGGSRNEGFALDVPNEVRLMQPTGRAIGYPESMIVMKRELTEAQAAKRARALMAKEIEKGGATHLVRATAAALRMGLRAEAAELLPRIVALDTGDVIRVISKDVPADVRDALFRAYSNAAVAAQLPPPTREPDPKLEPEPEPEVKRTNPLTDPKPSRTKLGGSRKKRTEVEDSQARSLMSKARPHREHGDQLFKKVQSGGLKSADPDEVNQAIRSYETALDLYEKAFLREDNDTIYALMTGCSKRLFQLRFWKDQLGQR